MAASGPLHLSFLLPGPLSFEYLHGSLPHLIQVCSNITSRDTGSKITVPFLPYISHLPSQCHLFPELSLHANRWQTPCSCFLDACLSPPLEHRLLDDPVLCYFLLLAPYVVIEQMECREITQHRPPLPSILIKSLMKGRYWSRNLHTLQGSNFDHSGLSLGEGERLTCPAHSYGSKAKLQVTSVPSGMGPALSALQPRVDLCWPQVWQQFRERMLEAGGSPNIWPFLAPHYWARVFTKTRGQGWNIGGSPQVGGVEHRCRLDEGNSELLWGTV